MGSSSSAAAIFAPSADCLAYKNKQYHNMFHSKSYTTYHLSNKTLLKVNSKFGIQIIQAGRNMPETCKGTGVSSNVAGDDHIVASCLYVCAEN